MDLSSMTIMLWPKRTVENRRVSITAKPTDTKNRYNNSLNRTNVLLPLNNTFLLRGHDAQHVDMPKMTSEDSDLTRFRTVHLGRWQRTRHPARFGNLGVMEGWAYNSVLSGLHSEPYGMCHMYESVALSTSPWLARERERERTSYWVPPQIVPRYRCYGPALKIIISSNLPQSLTIANLEMVSFLLLLLLLLLFLLLRRTMINSMWGCKMLRTAPVIITNVQSLHKWDVSKNWAL
jgi:protein-S-isoprenylcysteine O-methyltransferase Ste14